MQDNTKLNPSISN